MTAATLSLLLPEMVLIVAAAAIYLGGAFFPGRKVWRWLAGGAIAAAAVFLWWQHGPVAADASPPLHFDQLAWLARWLALGVGGLLLLLAAEEKSETGTERVGSLLLVVAGLMLVGVAGDLVLLFVALELISIPTYVLLYLGRRDAASQEATAKYFFLSVLSSAILLYGFSFLYGIAGSTELAALREAVAGTSTLPQGFAVFSKLALALVFGGLSFRITAVPFHFYAPNVYQGTTHTNAALLSVVPKAAGFLVLTRILVEAMPHAAPYTWQIVLGVSMLTMTFGNCMALWQDDLRRLMAYSSIANAGYMLLALAVALATVGGATAWNGIAAVAFYLATYSVATIGVFAAFEHLGRPDRSLDGVDELAGLGSTKPAAAAVLAVCLFSLTGIPPLAGFWGKFFVFGGALSVDPAASGYAGMRWWFVAAAVVGVLNAAVAAAYYLRIVAAMYFRTPLATPRAQGGAGASWAAVTCALLLVGVGLHPGPLAGRVEAVGKGEAVDLRAKLEASGKKKPPLQPAPKPGMAATQEVALTRSLCCPTCTHVIIKHTGDN